MQGWICKNILPLLPFDLPMHHIYTYILRNEKFLELKVWDIGMDKKKDKIGMGYESLHTMELLSVQCLQVDDVQ